MSNSHENAPLSVEDIAEAWLDVQLTRVDGANAKAAARVLALIEPKLRLLVTLQRGHSDIRRAIPGDVPAHGDLAIDVQYMAEDRAALQARVAHIRQAITTALLILGNIGAKDRDRFADACRVLTNARDAADAMSNARAPDTERTPIPQSALSNDTQGRRRRRTPVNTEIALIASTGDGSGVVLVHDGDMIAGEIDACSNHIGDLGVLDRAPEGLSIWEGTIKVYADDDGADVSYRGKFRHLERSERLRFALTGCPWATVNEEPSHAG